MADQQPLSLQVAPSTPLPPGTEVGTNLVVPEVLTVDRVSHMSEDIFDMRPTSHIMKLLNVLLGEAGVGQLRKASTLARLTSTINGTHFLALDSFYGALFNIKRLQSEELAIDPINGVGTTEDWLQAQANDASFRSRIYQFARAITFGATPMGMEFMAEALLNVDCRIYESFVESDLGTQRTYGNVESNFGTYGGMEGRTYGQIERNSTNPAAIPRNEFQVIPKRPLTEDEHYLVTKVLDVFKPANTVMRVEPDGDVIHTPAPVAAISADSTYWEVQSYILKNGTFQEIERPPFSSYQSEAWSYLGDLAGMSSYTAIPPILTVISNWITANGDGGTAGGGGYHFAAGGGIVVDTLAGYKNAVAYVRQQSAAGATSAPGITLPRGVPGVPDFTKISATHAGFEWPSAQYDDAWQEFGPEKAIMPLSRVLQGRAVSDGVITLRSSFVWTTGSTISFQSSGTLLLTDKQTIDSARENIYVQGRVIKDMQAALDAGTLPVSMGTDSGPARYHGTPARMHSNDTQEIVEFRFYNNNVINQISFDVARYPQTVEFQAFINGEWTTMYRRVIHGGNSQPFISYYTRNPTRDPHAYNQQPFFETSNLWMNVTARVLPMAGTRCRLVLTRLSIEEGGQSPIGRNGEPVPYQLAVRNFDVGYKVESELDLPRSSNSDEYIATASDLLGDKMQFVAHREPASNLLTGGAWRCAPQPVGEAVVNAYVDLRLANGDPQVIDRIFLDPIYVGPSFHIYWSDDDPPEDFVASDEVLPAGAVSLSGNVLLDVSGVNFPTTDPAWIEIDNALVQFDPAKSWALGITVVPRFYSGGANNSVLDFGSFKITFVDGAVRFTMAGASSHDVATVFAPNETVSILISYSATSNTATLYVKAAGRAVTNGVLMPIGSMTINPLMRIGSALNGQGVVNSELIAMFLRSGTLEAADFDLFAAAPTDYVVHPRYEASGADYTSGMMFRFSSAFMDENNVTGFIGGIGSIFDTMEWTPISRDYTLQKGFVRIPPTRCRFLNFEFSNLAPVRYDAGLHPVIVDARVSTSKAIPHQTSHSYAPWPGQETARALALQTRFRNSPQTFDQRVQNAFREPQTAAIRFLDPMAAKQAASTPWYMRYHDPYLARPKPMTELRGVRVYGQIRMLMQYKWSYLVGLKALIPYRLDYLSQDDATVYYERFLDTAHIEEGFTWEMDPGDISTGEDADVVMVSKTLPSSLDVIGVQFATQQTAAVQIVPNDDFTDPALMSTTWTDLSDWHAIGDAYLTYSVNDTTVLVERRAEASSTVPPLDAGPMQDPQIPPFDFDRPTSSPVVDHTIGGIESILVPVSIAGMVHGAVRFTALSDLVYPVTLQLLNDADVVLVEKDITARAGDLIEDYISYEIGPSVPAVRVRLVQKGTIETGANSWKLDRLSVFDDSITWEFSVDGGVSWVMARAGIRNNPNGVVTFLSPGSALKWRVRGYRPHMHVNALQIRPWYAGRLSRRKTLPSRGPNRSVFDQDPPIDLDPEFQRWWKPVPLQWWLQGRSLPQLSAEGTPIISNYRRFYGRSITITLATPIETWTRTSSLVRSFHFPIDVSVQDDGVQVGGVFPVGDNRKVGGTIGALVFRAHP